mmetsp:Transcript_36341/g.40133  ORF Transcript_36341/g.40133 Transcript_36341/m.40133 type:complete len:243 (+) Transcript_36341:75-803(+)
MRILIMKVMLSYMLLLLRSFAFSWQPTSLQQRQRQRQLQLSVNRREIMEDIMTTTAAMSILLAPMAAQAKDEKFGNMGSQTPLPIESKVSSGGGVDGLSTQFATLPNGVKFKDFKIGTGDETVRADSRNVSLQMSGRLINTNAGITFYNTKNNNPDGFGAIPLIVDLNKGEALPGFEAGLVGMKKGGIRRIVVPPGDLSYNKYPTLEPKPINSVDQRALDSVVKNTSRDSTVMFDVKLERFK